MSSVRTGKTPYSDNTRSSPAFCATSCARTICATSVSAKAWITSTPCGKSFKPSPTASPTFRHSCLNVHVDFPLLQRIALPITIGSVRYPGIKIHRSEEHTSELQSRFDLVCRLLLEKK